MHIKFWYKSYKESRIATVISIIGGLFNLIGKIIPIFFVIELLKLIPGANKTETSNLYAGVVYFIIVSIVIFIIGFVLSNIAGKIALKERKKKLQLTCEEAEDLVYKRPGLKQWFLDNHPSYKQLHYSDIAYRNIDDSKIDESGKKIKFEKKKKGSLIFYFFALLLVAVAIAIFQNGNNKKVSNSTSNDKNSTASTISNKDNKNSDYEYEKKYQCYVDLNNDIVDCYNYSINLYFKSKGNGETVKHKYNPNEVDMGPIIKLKYETLEKVRKAANSEPKMDIDEDVIKLADATEKIYDLIGEIYCAYGGKEENGKKTDKTKEELHKEIYTYVKEYNGIYNNFSNKFKSMSIEHMSKELKNYKEKGDMDSYHTLNIMIKSEEIYQYFVDNNITNKNLFNINLDEYKKLLEDYNKAYSEFEKQDIKGGTCHTSGFREFVEAYHSFVNNIVNMVNNKTFNAGKLDAEPGLVAPNDNKDIQDRLYFYIDRIVSDYNSIQLFKN